MDIQLRVKGRPRSEFIVNIIAVVRGLIFEEELIDGAENGIEKYD